ncbi:malonate decarboxylase holo-ACP synthase [Microbispora corallina]|uniref:Malonate decarboxylase holo-ACP synthase n=1 Tax=Microbispora corallina TaxID=83302 RepID=A0ABQ4GC62_9ACTN|nr:malonate decarboxylase holo-ACP synthase [Microbispora corallina]GIH44568.1 malonate decarboxylase holo-ACP synthase [Microbispora corallina]
MSPHRYGPGTTMAAHGDDHAPAMAARPHDLLRIAGDTVADPGLPGWAAASLAACPWAVVRRAPQPPGRIPIGVRGRERWQRQAALVPAHAVTCRVPPEDLTGRRPRLPPLAATLAAVAVRLRDELDDDVAWGPIGGVGFELATGQPATHPGSDLDLLIRAPRRMEPALAARLAAAFAGLPRTVDCQVETPRGGISLTEWARTGGPALLRSRHGPELVDDPWARA